MDTLESKTADAILQQPLEVSIGEKTYSVAPPSIATLIRVSAAISKLPKVSLNSENILSESLYVAKDCEVLGEILAILILGAKRPQPTKRSFVRTKTEASPQDVLAKEILTELTPRQYSETLNKLLAGMDIAFFFGSTISLIGINLLRTTVKEETTAYGQ